MDTYFHPGTWPKGKADKLINCLAAVHGTVTERLCVSPSLGSCAKCVVSLCRLAAVLSSLLIRIIVLVQEEGGCLALTKWPKRLTSVGVWDTVTESWWHHKGHAEHHDLLYVWGPKSWHGYQIVPSMGTCRLWHATVLSLQEMNLTLCMPYLGQQTMSQGARLCVKSRTRGRLPFSASSARKLEPDEEDKPTCDACQWVA